MREKRKNIRLPNSLDEPIEAYIRNENMQTSLVKVVDISLNGIGFLADMSLEVDDYLDTAIILSSENFLTLCRGTVKFRNRISRSMGYGMELSLHSKDKKIIDRYITSRLSTVS